MNLNLNNLTEAFKSMWGLRGITIEHFRQPGFEWTEDNIQLYRMYLFKNLGKISLIEQSLLIQQPRKVIKRWIKNFDPHFKLAFRR